jgi:hypothetical protein
VLLSGRGEEEARASRRRQEAGARWTIVRASWFNQNFGENFLLESVLAGEIILPAGEAAEPFVDADDIADVAVAALTEDGHDGQEYELSGPRLLTFHDVADEISRATGRQVRYQPITSEQYAAVLRENDLPVEFVELFSKILDVATPTHRRCGGRSAGSPATSATTPATPPPPGCGAERGRRRSGPGRRQHDDRTHVVVERARRGRPARPCWASD